MTKTLRHWLDSDVARARHLPVHFLAEKYFFRDFCRPMHSDPALFFSPADGIVIYARSVFPDEPLVSVRGVSYSPRMALGDERYDLPSLVIGIFMTFCDVQINCAGIRPQVKSNRGGI